jgi:hypothetical protein
MIFPSADGSSPYAWDPVMKLDMAREYGSSENFLTQHQTEVSHELRPLRGKPVKFHYVREQMEFRIVLEMIMRDKSQHPCCGN